MDWEGKSARVTLIALWAGLVFTQSTSPQRSARLGRFILSWHITVSEKPLWFSLQECFLKIDAIVKVVRKEPRVRNPFAEDWICAMLSRATVPHD